MVGNKIRIFGVALTTFLSLVVMAGVDGSVSGTVLDKDGVAASQVIVQLLDGSGHVVKEVTTSVTGTYQIFPVTFGEYQISIKAKSSAPYLATVHVSSGGNTQADVNLT